MRTLCDAMLCGLLLAVGCAAQAAEPADPEPLVTLELRGLAFDAALASLSMQSGRRFLLAETAGPTALGPDISMSSVPLSVAIKTLSTVYGVCSVELPGIIAFQSCSSDSAIKPSKVRLGVALVTMTPENLYERGGIVTRVQPDSVAARVGIQPEDRIIAFDGHAINRASDLVDAVSKIEPGAAVAIEIVRGNRRLRLTASF